MKKLILKLSEFINIKIVPSDDIDLEQMYFCTDVKVFFQDENLLLIGEEWAGEIFEQFFSHLKKAINNELQLHESLHQNLGFIYNDFFDNIPDSMMVSSLDNVSKHWVIYDYKMWATTKDLSLRVATWLYNDDKGNIILEVTKTYPWFYAQDEDIEDPDFVYYEDFIKDYKSIIYCIIPRDKAIEWLNEAEEWLSVFLKNEKHCKIPTVSFLNKSKK